MDLKEADLKELKTQVALDSKNIETAAFELYVKETLTDAIELVFTAQDKADAMQSTFDAITIENLTYMFNKEARQGCKTTKNIYMDKVAGKVVADSF